MPTQIVLSESAVAVLRFRIRGHKMPVNEQRLGAYRELATAGIMESVPGSEVEYRFTEEGMQCREEILDREAERIERRKMKQRSRKSLVKLLHPDYLVGEIYFRLIGVRGFHVHHVMNKQIRLWTLSSKHCHDFTMLPYHEAHPTDNSPLRFTELPRSD